MIDRAFGRCKLAPQQITQEYIEIAKQLLYLHLSTLGNEGIPLWCKQKQIYPIYDSVQNIPLNTDVIDVLSCNLRTSTRLATGSVSSPSGRPDYAFDGSLTTACTLVAPNGFIQIQLPANAQAVIYGILPNVSQTWSYTWQASNDGVTWTVLATVNNQAVVQNQWIWLDIQGVPESGFLYYRISAGLTTTLDIVELVFETTPSEIPVAKINMDDYANLPDKFFPGRPVQMWFDKQLQQPQVTVWPAPQLQFTFNQFVLYVSRYIQDVGPDLTVSIEVPQRWLLAITTELARNLAMEIPEVKPEVLAFLGPEADKQLARAWASESDGAPTWLQPRIWNYTR
jgi:hypothetical protein